MNTAAFGFVLAALLADPFVQEDSAVGSTTFEFGRIRFEAPRDWEMSTQTEAWTPRDRERRMQRWEIFSWGGPFRAGETSLETQLASIIRSESKEAAKGRILRKPEFEVASGIQAVWELHEIPDPLDPSFHLDAIFECEGFVHHFQLETRGTLKKMHALIEEIRPFLESVRPRDLKPPTERGRIGRMTLKEKGTDVAGFLHRFDVPNSWKIPEDAEESNHVRTWCVERTVGDKTFRLPIVCEVAIGEVPDARLSLSAWLATRARPEPPDERPRITGRSELEFWTRTSASGAKIWSLTLRDEVPGGWVAILTGFLVQQNGVRLLLGTALRADAHAAAFWYSSTHLSHMLGVASRCALDLPPTQEKWKTSLIEKKRYRYAVDCEIPGDFADLSSHARQTIVFHPNGTCDIDENEGYRQSVAGKRYQPDDGHDLTLGDGGVDGFAAWTRSGSGIYHWRRDTGTGSESKIRGAAFEVRGAGEHDLWLVIRRSPTRVTFHRLEPDAKGTYGKRSTPHGLAIDGRIEGEYVWYGRDGAWAPWKD